MLHVLEPLLHLVIVLRLSQPKQFNCVTWAPLSLLQGGVIHVPQAFEEGGGCGAEDYKANSSIAERAQGPRPATERSSVPALLQQRVAAAWGWMAVAV